SAIALRRHKDQSRQCYVPPFGIQPKLVVSPTAPLDQYAFIESEDEEEPDHATVKLSIEDPLRRHATGLVHQKSLADSGVGSGSSTHSTSPPQSFDDDAMELHEEKEKRAKDDETDSGFRSRLNSSVHSCSPGSSSTFSTDGGSPSRKFSNAGTMSTDTMFASTSGIFPSMTSTTHYSAYHMHTRSHGSHVPATSAVNYGSLSIAPMVNGVHDDDTRDMLARSPREAMRTGGFMLAEDADISTLIACSSVHSAEAHSVLLSGKESASAALPEGLCPDDGDLRSAFDTADPSELVLEAIREIIWRMTTVVLSECVKRSRNVHKKLLLSQGDVAAVTAIVEADGGVEGAQASSSLGGMDAMNDGDADLH
ncbi:Protein F26A10.2, partial [Aphelenchoides avenae]